MTGLFSTRIIRTLSLGVVLAFVGAAVAGAPPGKVKTRANAKQPIASPKAPQSAKRFIVTYRKGASRQYNDAKVQNLVGVAGRALGVRMHRLRRLAVGSDVIVADRALDSAGIGRLRKELAKDPNVAYVSVDALWKPMAVPNDPMYPQQWHYRNGLGGIDVEGAWDVTAGAGAVVAVVDTGITDHPDLNGNVIPGYDFVSDVFNAADGDGRDPDAHDPGDGSPFRSSSWHGTHVAGTIAAVTNNGLGVAGIAHQAKVQPVRVLGAYGGFMSDIIDGIVWASGGAVVGAPDNPTPADVINVSLGGFGGGPNFTCDPATQAAITLAVGNGATVVAAAGNNGAPARYFSPANCIGTITVGATDPNRARSFFSNLGEKLAISAPGGLGYAPAEANILSTLNDGMIAPGNPTYRWYAGTSMAAPHVAGVAALIQAASATRKTPAEVEKILINTAYDGSLGFPTGCSLDFQCGSGVLNASRAVAVAAGRLPLPPAPPAYPGPTRPMVPMANGSELSGLAASDSTNDPDDAQYVPKPNDSLWYTVEVPPGAKHLLIQSWGASGDLRMLVRQGKLPHLGESDCNSGNVSEHACGFTAPIPGTYYIRLMPFGTNASFSGASLYAAFEDGNWPRNLQASAGQYGKEGVRVTLTWKAGKRRVDLYRNGALLRTLNNTGSATDSFRPSGSGRSIYTVCNSDTTECAPTVTAKY
ncbi:S8 family peptidase [Lysobacter sp. M2-1]|uniref:S8 family peptidase n=1 Tax=Lysobacter sp. M2-1 TaxID=2916839 RepID=UPI001F55C275|nr:S8 family peptidase [Lysobacter sp. M2-1]